MFLVKVQLVSSSVGATLVDSIISKFNPAPSVAALVFWSKVTEFSLVIGLFEEMDAP